MSMLAERTRGLHVIPNGLVPQLRRRIAWNHEQHTHRMNIGIGWEDLGHLDRSDALDSTVSMRAANAAMQHVESRAHTNDQMSALPSYLFFSITSGAIQ